MNSSPDLKTYRFEKCNDNNEKRSPFEIEKAIQKGWLLL
jgi:hypothetical protein